MQGDFDRAIPFTLHEEGGNVDDKDDPGGRTSRGVTQKTWDSFCKAMGYPQSDVFTAPQAKIVLLYRLIYWRRVGGDLLSWPLALAVFDTSVLHGVGRARRWLARAGNDWRAYIGIREASYEAIIRARPSSEVFREGWENRCARLRTACQSTALPRAA